MRLAVAVLALLVFAAPRGAANVAHVRLGSEIEELVAGPDGGAWVLISRGGPVVLGGTTAVGRAGPDGRFRTAATPEPFGGAGLGPDGLAWFGGARRTFYRADADGRITRAAALPESVTAYIGPLATGGDGTLWAMIASEDTFARVSAGGVVSFSEFAAPPCPGSRIASLRRAPDGAMWFTDPGCERLVRAGAAWSVIALGQVGPEIVVAPDASGGAWFAAARVVGHTDGTRIAWPEDVLPVSDIAVGPDGAAWLAFGQCRLGRIAPGGALSYVPAPVPVRRLAFDPAGGLWLASPARLAHSAVFELSAAGCDDTPATVRVQTRISLAQLRRRGVRVTVREPAQLEMINETAEEGDVRHATLRTPGSAYYRPSRRALRRIGRSFFFSVGVTDGEGNTYYYDDEIRVTR